MLSYKKFEVEIERSVDGPSLSWPGRGEAGHDSGLGCNRAYSDLRGLSWGLARRVLALEDALVSRVESSADPSEELAAIDDELYEDDDEGLLGLDLGVAAVVAALSAAGCVPFSSCNAGAYDGSRHQESYPLVAFYARARHTQWLLGAAAEAGVGIATYEGGFLVAYADDIRSMRLFGRLLVDRSKPSTRKMNSRKRPLPDTQLSVFPETDGRVAAAEDGA